MRQKLSWSLLKTIDTRVERSYRYFKLFTRVKSFLDRCYKLLTREYSVLIATTNYLHA